MLDEGSELLPEMLRDLDKPRGAAALSRQRPLTLRDPSAPGSAVLEWGAA